MSFKSKITGFAVKAGKRLQQKCPTLMVVGGVAGLVVAGVLACKETHEQLDTVIAEHKEKVQAIKDIRDGVVVLDEISTEEYAEKKYKKHLLHIYLCTICKLAKVYAPAFLLATASVFSILWGHKIVTRRHLAAVAECYAVRETLNEYRKRVADRVGAEVEERIYNNEDVEVVTQKVKDADGKEKEELRESVAGKGDKQTYCYIASRETIKSDWWDDDEQLMISKLEGIWLEPANHVFEDRGELTIIDCMRAPWEREYLKKFPEIRSAGWWRDNPYAAALPTVRPIGCHVHRISQPGEPLVLSVTFNAQGDIYAAMELAKQEQRECKARFRKRARVKPAFV